MSDRPQICKINPCIPTYTDLCAISLCFENKGFHLLYKLSNLLHMLFKEIVDGYVCGNIEKKL